METQLDNTVLIQNFCLCCRGLRNFITLQLRLLRILETFHGVDLASPYHMAKIDLDNMIVPSPYSDLPNCNTSSFIPATANYLYFPKWHILTCIYNFTQTFVCVVYYSNFTLHLLFSSNIKIKTYLLPDFLTSKISQHPMFICSMK